MNPSADSINGWIERDCSDQKGDKNENEKNKRMKILHLFFELRYS